MLTKTKIICTMGPAVNSYEQIIALIEAGMNVARLNFSHGTLDGHLEIIKLLKKARVEKKVPLAIMIDTKGPEIRLGLIPAGVLDVLPGQKVHLVRRKEDDEGILMTPEIVFEALEIGTRILFDDGYIGAKVIEKTSAGVCVEIENAGILKNHKGVNIPNVKVPLPAMTSEDEKAITFGCEEGVDIIAASFIRSADHVMEIKELLVKLGRSDIVVIAKIEDVQGVENFESILSVADGIMVARGDLGVELPLYQVPSLQKMMIQKCYYAAKPVITATQMLESMIYNPRPTRAEVSDVANAIYDSTSAVMLSGETAIGLYPIETVKMMKSIILEAEGKFLYREFFDKDFREDFNNISFSVAQAAVKTAYSVNAKAIFVFTNSGLTARMMARFRPEIPIFALSPTVEAYHRMALLWGVVPVPPYDAKNMEEALCYVSAFAKEKGVVHPEDIILMTAGSPFGISGTTNMMIVEKVEGSL
ncbi:MAG: pyruvate kinase [Chlamydiota bacterium]